MGTKTASWWTRCVVHNVMIHPLLPSADLAHEVFGSNAYSELIYWAHDHSAPEGGG